MFNCRHFIDVYGSVLSDRWSFCPLHTHVVNVPLFPHAGLRIFAYSKQYLILLTNVSFSNEQVGALLLARVSGTACNVG